jgi:cytochrome b561
MSRTVAVVLHGLSALLAAGLYFLFVIPRWWEVSGETSHALGTAMRIVAGVLIALASLPVVFTWLRTRRPEYGTPQLALRLRVCSIVLHVLAGALIIGTGCSVSMALRPRSPCSVFSRSTWRSSASCRRLRRGR